MQLKRLSMLLTLSICSASAVAMPTWQTSSATAWQMPTLNSNQSALVFIRANKGLSTDANTNIALDDRFVTSLQDNHYATEVVCSGSVQISAMPTKALTNDLSANAFTIGLAPRQVQYVYVDVDSRYQPKLSPLSEADAKKLLSTANMQVHQISRHQSDNCGAMPVVTAAPVVQPAVVVVEQPVVVANPASATVPVRAPVVVEQQIPTLRLNILFDHDKSVIKPMYLAEIDRAAAFLAQYPGAEIAIEGHTDSTGDASYNERLSQRRADAVKNALVSRHGIMASRIYTYGYGEARPIASNDTAAGRAENRRVIIAIPKN